MNTNQNTRSEGRWPPDIDRVPAAPDTGPSTSAALAFPIIRTLFLVALATALVLAVVGKLHDRSPGVSAASAPRPTSAAETQRAVNRAVTHLIARRLEGGCLRDRVHLNPEMAVSDSVNAFRHCLSLHALCNSVNDENREQIVAELSPLAGWIVENTLSPLDGRSDMHGMRPPHGKNPRDLSLRLSAMGLLALSEAHGLEPEVVGVEDLKKLGRFVSFMQRRDGAFYVACQSGNGNQLQESGGDWSDANLAGLACLSLVRLYEIDRDPQWLERAEIGIRHVADGMRGRDSFNTDDWFPVAIQSFVPHIGRLDGGIQLATLEECCRKMAFGIASNYPDLGAPGTDKIETRELARPTRALGALLAVLDSPQDERLQRGIRSHADRGIAFLTVRQIGHGGQLGGFSRSGGKGLEQGNSRFGEVRLDYTSYSLLALDTYRRLQAK